MNNFFAELKRRHIYRVAATYTVVAWLLVQLVNNIAPLLRLPDWVGAAILMLLMVGFPLALIFAWVLELRAPEGQMRRGVSDWVLAAVAAAIIAIFAYQQLGLGARTTQQEGSVVAARQAAAAPAGISVAVLPFVNLSSDKEQEFFSDGMTDEISGALAKIADLRVVARTSAFQFKGEKKDMRAIGQALAATHLIEGSVRKAGNRVRISVELVKADDGLQLWSDNYDRDLTDVFAIQEDIAHAIAVSLRMPLGLKPGESLVNSRTKDESLHEDYLRAKALVRTRTPGNGGRQGLAELTQAANILEQVVARESDFAPAWALLGLAYAYIPLRGLGGGDFDKVRAVVADVLPKAEAAASRAIKIDPKNADGYFTLAFIQHVRTKQQLAMDSFAKAIALDPTNPDGLHIYSDALADLGYVMKSLPLRQQLQELEPFVPVYRGITARILAAAGQYDESIAIYSSSGVFGGSGFFIAEVLAAKGLYQQAADALEGTPGIPQPTLDSATRLLRTLPAKGAPQTLPQLGRGLQYIYAYTVAPDRVMEPYEQTLKTGYVGPGDNVYLWTPAYAAVRKTDRFKAYMREINMVDYWRKNGWPDSCHPVGADDFACE